MAEILGLGMSHFPALLRDENLPGALYRMLAAKRVPEHAKDPRSWPPAMQAEYGDDRGVSVGRQHRDRCHEASRQIRARLDAFKPDVVVIFGDDQYENFTEEVVPPFCVYLADGFTSQPFAADPKRFRNFWGEPVEKTFEHRGALNVGRWLVNRLSDEGTPLPYAYSLRYPHGLAHAFINTLLLLDVDRRGFDYPVLPFHVNCYGGDLIRSHGGTIAISDTDDDVDPPAPSPAACYDLGRHVGRAFAASPWRVALIASSSWSHATLTRKTNWIYPDHASDRARFAELRDGHLPAWRSLTTAQLEDAGQHELLNWIVLAGAMAEMGKRTEIVDWVETWVMNSTKCFAVFA